MGNCRCLPQYQSPIPVNGIELEEQDGSQVNSMNIDG